MIQIANYSSLLQEGFIPTAFSWNSSHAITAVCKELEAK